MPIEIGQQLGSLEVTALLGKGGMGEVYRARDTKLKRDVAIKILPDEFARDTDRVGRFQREAEVLASLNHPNIGAIHNLDEYKGSRFLVLELVEGETLAQRISRGPIPLAEALMIAASICEALEAAHDKGVIHRDLKPANVKITPDGTVKVLDFGLAKGISGANPSPTMTNSPTLMSMAGTNAGLIMGTASYMSPEQAKGKPLDRRTDIFAFGCVLFEMLTGQRAFDGEDVPEIMSRILQREPDWALLPANAPTRIRELLKLCLQKNSKNRRASAADVRIDIDQASAYPGAETPANTGAIPARSNSLGRIFATAGIGLILGAAVVLAIWAPWRAGQPAAPLRLSTEIGADVSLPINDSSTLALSPDGSMLAFVGEKSGKDQLYIRRLGQLQATPLAGTDGATDPFFSPDGQWIAFFADGKLKKISITGGAAVSLGDAPNDRGGAWGEDGNIVFTPNNTAPTALQRVSSGGGKAEPLTTVGDKQTIHRWPQVLPGGKAVLYTADTTLGALDSADIIVQTLPSGAPKIVQHGGYYARYLPSGHLVYVHEGTVFAVTFDLNRLETIGQPTPVIEGLSTSSNTGRSQFAVSATGTIAYVSGQTSGFEAPVLWLDHEGKTTALYSKPIAWSDPQISPDGKKLAIDMNDGKGRDVWIYEWDRDTLTRFSFGIGNDTKPIWTPDGRRMVFASSRGDKVTQNLYWQFADGTGDVQRLTESKNPQTLGSWHPSGKFLAFQELRPQSGWDLMILPMEGDESTGWKPGKPTVFLGDPLIEQEPIFSPDGRWIAYQASESGRIEIYVRPFPGPGGKWQISTDGGANPMWSRTRNELFYRQLPGNHIMVVSYSVEGNSFKADKPRLWSNRTIQTQPGQRWLDLHPDGNRFAVSAAPENLSNDSPDKVVFIFNFFDELRRIARSGKN
jgi:serine/threonine-protein kinase